MWWIIQNWEARLGAEMMLLSLSSCWEITLVVLPVLGQFVGDCLETSSLHLLLKSISTCLREITIPIYNIESFCHGNMSSRGWRNVIESVVIQEMALFPNIFHAPGKKRLLVLMSVSHSSSFDIWKPLFPVAVFASLCWTSVLCKIIFKRLFS